MTVTPVTIPNRPVFRAQEVCELAEVQPFVLRTWEAEFPDLGVAKTANGPRMYRRADVARVLRIKHLLFVDGLTLAGARRRLAEDGDGPVAGEVADADIAAMMDGEVRQQLRDVRRGLQGILGVLGGDGRGQAGSLFDDAPVAARAPKRTKARGGRTARAPKPARAPKAAPAASSRTARGKKR